MILSMLPFVVSSSESFDELVKKSIELAKLNNANLEEKYKIGTWKTWNIDQETNILSFSSDDKLKLSFKACIVGSISAKSKTWLWSWANNSILPSMSSPMLLVKEYGNKNGHEKLINEKWNAEEVDGWEMSAVASKIILGLGVYRGPTNNGFIFIIPIELIKYDP